MDNDRKMKTEEDLKNIQGGSVATVNDDDDVMFVDETSKETRECLTKMDMFPKFKCIYEIMLYSRLIDDKVIDQLVDTLIMYIRDCRFHWGNRPDVAAIIVSSLNVIMKSLTAYQDKVGMNNQNFFKFKLVLLMSFVYDMEFIKQTGIPEEDKVKPEEVSAGLLNCSRDVLGDDKNLTLLAIMFSKLFTRPDTNVKNKYTCRFILRNVLNDKESVANVQAYLIRMFAYQLWKSYERDLKAKSIMEKASESLLVGFKEPLLKLKDYSSIIPKIPSDQKNITTHFIKCKFDHSNLKQFCNMYEKYLGIKYNEPLTADQLARMHSEAKHDLQPLKEKVKWLSVNYKPRMNDFNDSLGIDELPISQTVFMECLKAINRTNFIMNGNTPSFKRQVTKDSFQMTIKSTTVDRIKIRSASHTVVDSVVNLSDDDDDDDPVVFVDKKEIAQVSESVSRRTKPARALYAPPIPFPENNEDEINTTGETGSCVQSPQVARKEDFSVGVPLTTTISQPVVAASPRITTAAFASCNNHESIQGSGANDPAINEQPISTGDMQPPGESEWQSAEYDVRCCSRCAYGTGVGISSPSTQPQPQPPPQPYRVCDVCANRAACAEPYYSDCSCSMQPPPYYDGNYTQGTYDFSYVSPEPYVHPPQRPAFMCSRCYHPQPHVILPPPAEVPPPPPHRAPETYPRSYDVNMFGPHHVCYYCSPYPPGHYDQVPRGIGTLSPKQPPEQGTPIYSYPNISMSLVLAPIVTSDIETEDVPDRHFITVREDRELFQSQDNYLKNCSKDSDVIPIFADSLMEKDRCKCHTCNVNYSTLTMNINNLNTYNTARQARLRQCSELQQSGVDGGEEDRRADAVNYDKSENVNQSGAVERSDNSTNTEPNSENPARTVNSIKLPDHPYMTPPMTDDDMSVVSTRNSPNEIIGTLPTEVSPIDSPTAADPIANDDRHSVSTIEDSRSLPVTEGEQSTSSVSTVSSSVATQTDSATVARKHQLPAKQRFKSTKMDLSDANVEEPKRGCELPKAIESYNVSHLRANVSRAETVISTATTTTVVAIPADKPPQVRITGKFKKSSIDENLYSYRVPILEDEQSSNKKRRRSNRVRSRTNRYDATTLATSRVTRNAAKTSSFVYTPSISPGVA